MKKQKLTTLQQEYKKEVTRINKQLKAYERKGFVIPDELIPKMPARVTRKKLEEIKATKPKKIVSDSFYVSAETYGELIPAKQGFEIEKAKRKEKKVKALTDEAKAHKPRTPKTTYKKSISELRYENFKAMLMKYSDGAGARYILDKLDDMASLYGINRVAEMLKLAEESGDIFVAMYASDVDMAEAYIHRFTAYLDLTQDQLDELYDILDNGESYRVFD